MPAPETHALYDEINHPEQEGWFKSGLAAVDELYGKTDDEVSSAVALASLRTDVHRQRYQREALEYARLPDMYTYERLAGHPEQVGEQICWFGRAVLAAFALPPREDPFNLDTIALDLGGVRQLGVWNTAPLDTVQADIADQVRRADPSASITLLEQPGQRHPSYRVLPVVLENTDPDAPLALGMVRRERAVADVRVRDASREGESIVHVIKQSTAIYRVNEIDDPRARAILAKSPRQYRAAEDKPVENSPLAGAAGRVFEAAIRDVHAGLEASGAILPVSAHLLMLSTRAGT